MRLNPSESLPNALWTVGFSLTLLIVTDTIPRLLGSLWIVSSNHFGSSFSQVIFSHTSTDQYSAKYTRGDPQKISGVFSLGSSLLSCTLFSLKVAVNFLDSQLARFLKETANYYYFPPFYTATWKKNSR